MSYQNKKVLVTGGAGFVGSNLVNHLVEAGAEVTVLDDLFTGRKSNIKYINDIRFIQGTVTDYELVATLVKGADIVFNLAVRNIIVSTKSPLLDFQVNTGGTFNVLVAAKNFGIERVVYASSASVYGNPRIIPIPEEEHLSTLSPYAASKLAGENYCQAFYESYGLPVVVLRYSNVYGVNQSPSNPYSGVISKFFYNLMNNRSPQVHGDGEQTRDFTYVDDAVDATMRAGLSLKAEGEVFNVSSGKETSINDLVEKISLVTETSIPPVYIDRRDIDNIRRRVLNTEKIRRVLRWIPNTTLRIGLDKTYQWLLEDTKMETKKPRIHIMNRMG